MAASDTACLLTHRVSTKTGPGHFLHNFTSTALMSIILSMENLCFLIKLTLYKSHIRRRVPAEAIAIATPTQVNQEIRTSHV